MLDISVVIPSYNQPATIRQCLASVLAQDFTGSYEVIIVDSSSTEYRSAIAEVAAADERVRLIQLAQQTFPGPARNVGIKAAQSERIALIDSDCVAHVSWLSSIVKQMESGIILTGVIENGTPQSVYGTCSFLVEFNHFLAPKQPRQAIHAAATCNFACHKTVFEEVGYFTDDRAFEDMLFCNKYKSIGGTVYQFRNIKIKHVNKTELAPIIRNQKMLGFYSAKVRRANGLPPQLVFRLPLLTFGLLAFRYVSIFSRGVRSKYFGRFLWYTPVVLWLLLHWSIGFYRGAQET
ncbi:MAG: glycosyltransferase family 2 protein [Bacteroidota bacterium]